MESIIDIDRWTLTVAEREVVMRKSAAHRLDVALLLKFFQSAGRFPASTEIEPAVAEYVAAQLDIVVSTLHALKGRTLERVRSEIRALCGFREAAVDDAAWLSDYLCEHAVPQTRDHERLAAAVLVACRERRIEPPTDERIERIIRHAVNIYEEGFYARTLERLTPSSRAALDALLSVPAGDDASDRAVINTLRADAGRIGINSIKDELAKLELVRKLDLPADLFGHAQAHELELYRKRVAVEAPYELRRHPEATRRRASKICNTRRCAC